MEKITIEVEDYGKVSDGYHTIQELYDHRAVLYIALCKRVQDWMYSPAIRSLAGKDWASKKVWRSLKHSDGSMYEGWFVLGINRKKGQQITYHLPLSFWGDTDFAETLGKAPKWDGHTSADVLERIKNLTTNGS